MKRLMPRIRTEHLPMDLFDRLVCAAAVACALAGYFLYYDLLSRLSY